MSSSCDGSLFLSLSLVFLRMRARQTLKGVHYEESFSPVVSWSTIRMMLTLASIHDWHARQIDFVLAFPQAKVRTDIYMHVPEKFEVKKKKMVLNEQAKHHTKKSKSLLRDFSLRFQP